ncbi:MAG: Gfo/Idh/MocA family oxidoreductase [Lachnospiraceae bacterium]|jgi:UDP-N-acetyl-2-amino-2-deoxyglucuronate dehydrogenase|nr:Gfo/Idh/MocA family oxidoreductase [Lachnospiraceae bacterium]
MKYALIGCGRIAKNHMKAACHNNLEMIAVCDVKMDAMNAILDLYELGNRGSIKKYEDYQKLIDENPELQLVSIATESGSHAKIALYCIKHGIHVIIEKPIAMSMEDAKEIILQAQEHKVKVCACHQNRFNLAVQKMKHARDEDRFGKISHGSIHVRWNRNREYYKQAEWRGKWGSDGGALMNQCIHGIDLIRWIIGDEIQEVYGATRQRYHEYMEAEDVGMALIQFKSGIVATIEGSVNVYPKNLEETLFLFGEKGTVKLGGTSTNNIDIWEFSDKNDGDKDLQGLKEETCNVYGNGHISLFRDMMEAIEKDREPYVNGVDGRNALELVLAIYKSQKTGKPVKLPLEEFSSNDMAGEFNE